MSDISVTILTKNSSETIGQTLDSLHKFSEVLILDTGSSDETLQIAKKYPNARICKTPFSGFGKLHNLAASMAKNDWILSIDSDEVLSDELIEEIFSLQLDVYAVYALNRCNYFQGKWIQCCSGWYPDWIVRLYNKKRTSFTENEVHETVIADGLKRVFLKEKCLHTPYTDIESFLSKMQLYSTLFAKENCGKHSTVGKAIWHGIYAFFKNYLFKRGFLAGKEGLIISIYNAQTTYYKYLKLAYPKLPQDLGLQGKEEKRL